MPPDAAAEATVLPVAMPEGASDAAEMQVDPVPAASPLRRLVRLITAAGGEQPAAHEVVPAPTVSGDAPAEPTIDASAQAEHVETRSDVVRAIEHGEAPASRRSRAGYERADPTAAPEPVSTPAPVPEPTRIDIPVLAPFQLPTPAPPPALFP
jgi:hypothetical protein